MITVSKMNENIQHVEANRQYELKKLELRDKLKNINDVHKHLVKVIHKINSMGDIIVCFALFERKSNRMNFVKEYYETR